MDLIPTFEIGLLNAWIFTFSLFITSFLSLYIKRDTLKKISVGWEKIKRSEKIVFQITHILVYLTLIYSLFLPFKLNTSWFFIGLPISFLGFFIILIASINFVTTSIENEPVTKGMYRFSRHPMYFGSFVVYCGIGIACASWIFLLCALIFIISWNFVISSEEQDLVNYYGDAYREYIKLTPKWIGLPKSRKKD
jgi:protein-S-isoprenylcysteine O-methyltransferase Ste14